MVGVCACCNAPVHLSCLIDMSDKTCPKCGRNEQMYFHLNSGTFLRYSEDKPIVVAQGPYLNKQSVSMHSVFGDPQTLDRSLLAEAEFLLLHDCCLKSKLTRKQIKQLTLGSEFTE